MKKTMLPIATDCNGCGVCCLHMGYPAFILPNSEEQIEGEIYWHALPLELRGELDSYVKAYRVEEGQLDGPCFWLDLETMLCKHHEHRPRVCREFEIGSRLCRQWREHYRDDIECRNSRQ